MAEHSYLWTTDGVTGDGAETYTTADWSGIINAVALDGVAPGYGNELTATVTGANAVSVASGAAIVDGKPYRNTTPLAVAIPSAVGAGNTRIDRIVLRTDWLAQTVRITRIAGTDAAIPAAPEIVQTSGTTYDIHLYRALVDASGTVTLTDERDWPERLRDGEVAEAKLAFAVATQAELDAHKATGDHDARYAMIVNGVTGGDTHNHAGGGGAQIGTDGIANNAITPDKIENRTRRIFVPPIGASGPEGKAMPGTGAANSGYGLFYTPADHAESGSMWVRAIVRPASAGQVRIQMKVVTSVVDSQYAGNSHDDVAETLAMAAVYDYFTESCGLPLNMITTDALVRLELERSPEFVTDTLNDNLYLRGFLVEYIADS